MLSTTSCGHEKGKHDLQESGMDLPSNRIEAGASRLALRFAGRRFALIRK
jgi:hypothetical protein